MKGIGMDWIDSTPKADTAILNRIARTPSRKGYLIEALFEKKSKILGPHDHFLGVLVGGADRHILKTIPPKTVNPSSTNAKSFPPIEGMNRNRSKARIPTNDHRKVVRELRFGKENLGGRGVDNPLE